MEYGFFIALALETQFSFILSIALGWLEAAALDHCRLDVARIIYKHIWHKKEKKN
jgi:hypothetical protein